LQSYTKTVHLLLAKGADTNVPGGAWFDTLRVGGWSVQIVQQILQKDHYLGVNHLLSALLDTDPQVEAVVPVLLPYITSEVAAQVADVTRWPLLTHAADWGSALVTQKCLDLGLDINAKSYRGNTALHCAALNEHLAIVKMLVQAGSDLNARNGMGHTPLTSVKIQVSEMSTRASGGAETPWYGVIQYLTGLSQEGAARSTTENDIEQLPNVSSAEFSPYRLRLRRMLSSRVSKHRENRSPGF